MNHWPKIVSLVMLDPQALLTIGTISSKNIVMSGERLGPWASCLCVGIILATSDQHNKIFEKLLIHGEAGFSLIVFFKVNDKEDLCNQPLMKIQNKYKNAR